MSVPLKSTHVRYSAGHGMKIAIACSVIAFSVLVASVSGAAAQMWTEDMSNGARSNPGSQSVQPRATWNGSQSYGAGDQSATRRDNSARRGTVNPYTRSDRDTRQNNTWQNNWGR
jgi:hypothetical protein